MRNGIAVVGDKDSVLAFKAIGIDAYPVDGEMQTRNVVKELARKYSGDLFNEKKILHSPAGATFARENFGIEDREILDAICYHTTGRGNMSVLEKIVYLADKIEPSRTYMDLAPIRKAAEHDLDEAVRMTAAAVRDKFVSQGRALHPVTTAMMKDLGM